MKKTGNNTISDTQLGNLFRQLPVAQQEALDWDRIRSGVLWQPRNSLTAFFAPLANLSVQPWFKPFFAIGTGALATLAIGAMLVSHLMLPADRNGSVVHGLVHIKGTVTMGAAGQGSGANTVSQGNTYVTGRGSLLVASVEKETGFALAQRSRLTIERSQQGSHVVRLDTGMVAVKLTRRAAGDVFDVITPNAVCRAIGTVFTVSYDGVATHLAVSKGTVRIVDRAHPEKTLDIPMGKAVALVDGQFDEASTDWSRRELESTLEMLRPSPTVPNAADAIEQQLPVPQVEPREVVPLQTDSADEVGGVEVDSVALVPDSLAADTGRPEVMMPQSDGPGLPKPAPVVGNVVVPERYKAGLFCGITFYWDHEPFRSDTLNVPVIDRTAAQYAVSECSALGVHILRESGLRVFFLSRWTSGVDIRDGDSRGALEANSMVTPFLWEEVNSSQLLPSSQLNREPGLQLLFRGCGSSRYSHAENIKMSRSQMLGGGGLELIEKTRRYVPDENPYRLVVGVWAVDPFARGRSELSARIDKVMDAMGLDIRVKPPALVKRALGK